MGANTLTITESNFDQEVLKASEPVLVDFWAEWCGPCKMIGPIIDEIATEKQGAAKVAKVNIDNEQGLAVRYGIRQIPTMLLFKGGEVREQLVGARYTKQDLISKIEALA